MIAKIDHLAFGSSNFEGDLARFTALGYAVQFKETNLVDLENKRALLQRFTGHLDMALLTRPGSLAIEVLNHDHTFHGPTWVYPVFGGTSFDGAVRAEGVSTTAPRFIKWRTDTEEFLTSGQGEAAAFRCDTIVVETSSVADATKFWQAFGFRLAANSPDGTQMEFYSFASGGRFHLHVIPRGCAPARYFLDSQGFNCVAVFSTDPVKDHQSLGERGLSPGPLENIRVNGKDLSIFWVVGPEGEIVEVIGLAKRRH